MRRRGGADCVAFGKGIAKSVVDSIGSLYRVPMQLESACQEEYPMDRAWIANCKLQNANCKLQIENGQSKV